MTELGKRLEEARKQKNLSLDELQDITKIQKRYLQAIEAGNYDAMPGKFYARAFIKQYAEAVGLNPEKLFEEFSSEVPKTETEVSSTLSRAQKKQASVSKTSSAIATLIPKLLIALLIISVIVFIWLFMQKQNLNDNNLGDTVEPAVESQQDENVTIVNPDDEPAEPVGEEQNEPPTSEHEEPAVPETPEQPTAVQQLTQIDQTNTKAPTTTYELTGTDQFSVELESSGNSYIDVANGIGKTFYAGELKAGEKLSYDFTAEQEIEMNIGRTLDVLVKINGQDIEYPFPPNEKVHQKIKIIFNKEVQ